MSLNNIEIIFQPYLSWSIMITFSIVSLLAILSLGYQIGKGVIWRGCAIGSILLVLANPLLISNASKLKKNLVVVAVDRTGSQQLQGRKKNLEDILSKLVKRLNTKQNLKVEIVDIRDTSDLNQEVLYNNGTLLFGQLTQFLSTLEKEDVAGIILLTDGQIHDGEKSRHVADSKFPIHTILTGKRDEKDRSIELRQAPSYGILGNSATITILVRDKSRTSETHTPVTVTVNEQAPTKFLATTNKFFEITIPIEHSGKNIVRLSIQKQQNELSHKNNNVTHQIYGIREQLNVLMISGAPHSGQKTWRKFLKSDPSVNLIHFTILRPPNKIDDTPREELSLITFPIQQIFEKELKSFDLIILDQYKKRGIIPPDYLENISDYVNDGGALFEAAGPSFASSKRTSFTPLRKILPAVPTGQIIEQGFRPQLTAIGLRHPVTSALSKVKIGLNNGSYEPNATWGRWFRQIETRLVKGDVLLTGPSQKPLLILARIGQGRIAQLLSDQIWLWDRGYQGGGPHGELLRKVAHWLMKEPELEENTLRIRFINNQLQVQSRSTKDVYAPISLIHPNGSVKIETPKQISPGEAVAYFKNSGPGLYKATDGNSKDMMALGSTDSREYLNLLTTPEILNPIISKTGGKIFWPLEDGFPDIRLVKQGRTTFGKKWLGLQSNNRYSTSELQWTPLLDPILWLTFIIGCSILAWRKEAR
ncbi:MAG: hypothetical protein CMM58_12020 [Rhodospirillaceae bacterium]|nr:hypothetical protein [Rhodospirillaceae bacterium]